MGMLTKEEAQRIALAAPIPGYEKTYRITEAGEVFSLPRPTTPGGLRKWRYDRHGYPYLNLCQDGVERRFRIHILVALTFIGPRPEGLMIRHLDGNPGNPQANNLTYGTASENGKDSVAHGTNWWSRKTHCPRGHEYSEENTLRSGGRRYCRACRKPGGREC